MRCTAIPAVAKSLTALASLDMGANIKVTAILVVVQNANKMVRQRSSIRCNCLSIANILLRSRFRECRAIVVL